MTGKLAFFALGYMLGTRAGRDRFVQLVEMARWLASREEVQTVAGLTRSMLLLALERGEQMAGRRAA